MSQLHHNRSVVQIISLVIISGAVVCVTTYLVFLAILAFRENERIDPIASLNVPRKGSWKIQSIDTMKQSRDLARGKLYDASFDRDIESQLQAIADTGANYVAIDTPYDAEFLPFLRRWVTVAREKNLHVWFRGNWSGWEGWFDYPKNLSREQHIEKTKMFILKNDDIFHDGDIFSACPECENGGPGDPRQTGDVEGYRKFVIGEYQVQMTAFSQIRKKVQAYYPSNRDVAKLIMNPETTRALGGVVVIDHYIDNADQMARDIEDMAKSSGGRVVLGEFGVPSFEEIRTVAEKRQASWMNTVLNDLMQSRELIGVNYWVNIGGSTALWNEDGEAHVTVSELKKYFLPNIVYGVVTDAFSCPIKNAKISASNHEVWTKYNGYFELRDIGNDFSELVISAPGFVDRSVAVDSQNKRLDIMLMKSKENSPLQKWWSDSLCVRSE